MTGKGHVKTARMGCHEVGMVLVGCKADIVQCERSEAKLTFVHHRLAPAPAAGCRIAGLVAARHFCDFDAVGPA